VATVECGGARVALGPGERVLDGLERAGVRVPSSCRAGACQSCLLRATRGTPPAAAQVGLKATLKAQGYFLACLAEPTEDLAIATADDAALGVEARVTAVEALGPDVAAVRLVPDRPLEYRPGQFVTVMRADGLARSYSLASHPDEDDALELHVRRLPGGRMSGWLASPEAVGARVTLRGPSGSCFYVPGAPAQPLLLAGAGTGLAPLLGIARDALRAGHQGPITLVHGGRTAAGLYCVDRLQALAAAHANVTYVPCVLEGPGEGAVTVGALDAVVAQRAPSLKGHRAYLCGDPDLVTRLRKKVFLAGARMDEIFADAFVTAPPPAPAGGSGSPG
jgi:NAD(P)H-flavin reductase/ferredoxin